MVDENVPPTKPAPGRRSIAPAAAAAAAGLLVAACSSPPVSDAGLAGDAEADDPGREAEPDVAVDVADDVAGEADLGTEAEPDVAVDVLDAVPHEADGETDTGTTVPRYPILFVHGHAGGLDDWLPTLRWLVDTDPRWDSFHEAGTESFRDWGPAPIPPSEWLFNFTYYNRRPSDARGSYTAGPGAIGSNFEFRCDRYDAAGRLPADDPAYYDGTVHEYSADLADFVAAVLAATGAPAVDFVAHSMGGLVVRSFVQFHGGAERTRRVMLVSSPMHGVSLADLAFLDPTHPSWMNDREFAEMDDAISFWDIGFHVCAVDGPALSWSEGLNETDEAAAERVTYYGIVGGNDEVLSAADVAYDHAEWQVVVPGANHNSIRDHPELRRRIVEYLGN